MIRKDLFERMGMEQWIQETCLIWLAHLFQGGSHVTSPAMTWGHFYNKLLMLIGNASNDVLAVFVRNGVGSIYCLAPGGHHHMEMTTLIELLMLSFPFLLISLLLGDQGWYWLTWWWSMYCCVLWQSCSPYFSGLWIVSSCTWLYWAGYVTRLNSRCVGFHIYRLVWYWPKDIMLDLISVRLR